MILVQRSGTSNAGCGTRPFVAFKAPALALRRRTKWVGCLLVLAVVLPLTVFTGCGPAGPERVIVSGTVTFNGEPVPTALIRFEPVEDSSAPMAGAVVNDGRYRADARGGIPVGTYKVRITANRNVTGRALPVAGAPVEGGVRQYIPKKYNEDTELQITVPSGSGEMTSNFDLID